MTAWNNIYKNFCCH